MAFYIDNAISWAQFRLRGGIKNLLLTSFGYAAAVIFFILLFYELADLPNEKMSVLEASSIMDLAFQGILLLILGGSMIAGSLRRDIANQLIESHRLMPLSPVQAIVGYLAGCTVQILALWGINVAVGAVLFMERGLPVQPWLISNLLLLAFCVSLWTVMALSTFVSRAIVAMLIGLVVSIAFSGGFIFAVAPGLLTFCSPMHGHTIFDFGVPIELTTGTVVALAAQGIIGVLCIRGAARKYADASALSLTLGPALAALGVWAALSWFGIFDFHKLRPAMLEYQSIQWRVLVVGAIATSMLVALLPVAAVASADTLRAQHRIDGDKFLSPSGRLWLCFPVALLFVMMPLTSSYNSLVVTASPFRTMPQTIYTTTQTSNGRVYTRVQTFPPMVKLSPPPVAIPVITASTRLDIIAATCTIFLLQAYLLMRLLGPATRRAGILILVITIFLWFVPIMADVIYYGVKNENPRLDFISLYSPIGTLTQALERPAPGLWLGLAGQAALCAVVAALFFARISRGAKKSGIIPFTYQGTIRRLLGVGLWESPKSR
jgi:hypothetical protein